MKLHVCALLLLAINSIIGAPVDYDDNFFEEKKYGIGADLGAGFNLGGELGVRSQNGSHSVFADTKGRAKATAGIGVYQSGKPIPKNPPNAYPIQYDPRYPMPVYYPQYPQYPVYDPRYPVPIKVPYPQYPMTAPGYAGNEAPI